MNNFEIQKMLDGLFIGQFVFPFNSDLNCVYKIDSVTSTGKIKCEYLGQLDGNVIYKDKAKSFKLFNSADLFPYDNQNLIVRFKATVKIGDLVNSKNCTGGQVYKVLKISLESGIVVCKEIGNNLDGELTLIDKNLSTSNHSILNLVKIN